jgi:penicillin-binding protein 1A
MVVVIVGLVGFSTAGAYALVQSWLVDTPVIDDMEAFNDARKTRLYASGGELLAEFYAQDREPVSSEQVSPNVFNATVAIEDERFWEHRGVDYYGIARAAVNDLMGGELQGASTITQQFVRQTLLQAEANESTIKRKVREAYLAMELEKKYTKEEVLMMYLNTINYGDGALGIQSAAQHYFSKNASELTVPEAALICGIPQSPTYNNPVEYPDNALSRRNMVLDRMYVNGYISEAELEEFKATELNLNLRSTSLDGIYREPYFSAFVRDELLSKFPVDQVFKGGLNVYTTIDLSMQQYAEEACVAKEETLPYNAEVSLLSVDPNTGYIKAMRGGKDFYADQFNTTTQMNRQAGSTFKVFALVTAIEEGFSPQTTVSGASPFTMSAEDAGGEPWRVENYGGQNMGTMSLTQATLVSSNTAYARVVRKIGTQPMIDVAHRMGITTEIRPYPSAVLGAEGVNTLEMASSFGTLATGGTRHEPTGIVKITDHNGNVIYDHESEAQGEQVLTPEVAHATNQVLKGVVTSGTGVQANLGWQVAAGKTGTADDYTDSWFVGYTPQLSTAVWIGVRGEREPIDDNVGGDNCCPVWKRFMNNVLDGVEAQDFPTADNPPYDPKATFMTAEEQRAAEAAARQREEEAAAAKKAEEDAEREAAEDAKNDAAQKPPSGSTTPTPPTSPTTPTTPTTPTPGTPGDSGGTGTSPPSTGDGGGGGGSGGGGSAAG